MSLVIVMTRTLRKELHINSHTNPFLPVQKPFTVPYDLYAGSWITLVSSEHRDSNWQSPVVVLHADQNHQAVGVNSVVVLTRVESLLKSQEAKSE